MRREPKQAGKILDQFFGRVAKPSAEQIQLSRRNILSRLGAEELHIGPDSVGAARMPLRFLRFGIAAAAVVAAIVGSTVLLRSRNVMGEAVQGVLYRVYEGETQALQIGEKLGRNTVIQSTGGGVFALADGSRVEMRSESEVSLERASDGIRIRLSKGGIVVNAAKQRAGHLYVQTKDLMVSVIGTVFLVNAEEEGSRVAVIQGEVQVQRDATIQKLLPGEQVVTSPEMPSVAPPRLAFLQQSALPIGTSPERFEVVSIRPSPPPPQGTRGGGGGGARPGEQPCFVRQRLQLDPGRLVVTRATLHGLIVASYGVRCFLPDGISGEPEWAKSERYDIQAVIPAGSPVHTPRLLLEGNAPNLQRMLQNMLADRFKLTLRREMKEMPAYDLVVEKPGKWECHLPQTCRGLRLSEDKDPDAVGVDKEGMTPIPTSLNLHVPIS